MDAVTVKQLKFLRTCVLQLSVSSWHQVIGKVCLKMFGFLLVNLHVNYCRHSHCV